MMMGRAAWTGFVLLALLAGCGPAVEGTVGMAVASNGHIIVLVETCNAVVESVSIERRSASGAVDFVWADDAMSQGHRELHAYDTGLVVADVAPGEFIASAETDDIDAVTVGTETPRKVLSQLESSEVLWGNDYSNDASPVVLDKEYLAERDSC